MAKVYIYRATVEFEDALDQFRGTDGGKAILTKMRSVLAAPTVFGEPSIIDSCVRFCHSGVRAWYMNWVVCESCFDLPLEERLEEEPCALCESRDCVVFKRLYISF